MGIGRNINVFNDVWLASGITTVLKDNANVTPVVELVNSNLEWAISLNQIYSLTLIEALLRKYDKGKI